MIFPESPRVVFRRNPLSRVVMQIRFPPILRLISDVPAKFQEHICSQYPVLAQKRELSHPLEAVLPKAAFPRTENVYEFVSEDEKWILGISSGFLSLTCLEYDRWETFVKQMSPGIEALQELYSPPFFTRLGLRYQNVIHRSKLEMDMVPWKDLLKGHVAGELTTEISAQIAHFAREFRVEDGREVVQVRHGFVKHNMTGEECYGIDADFFTESRLKHDEIKTRLDEFHTDAGRLFRWCIREKLYRSLGPE